MPQHNKMWKAVFGNCNKLTPGSRVHGTVCPQKKEKKNPKCCNKMGQVNPNHQLKFIMAHHMFMLI